MKLTIGWFRAREGSRWHVDYVNEEWACGHSESGDVAVWDSEGSVHYENGHWDLIEPMGNKAAVSPRSTESTEDLRNQFAGQAIVGVLSNPELLEFVDKEFPHMATREAAARYAFAVADSMLKVSKEV